MNTKLWFIGIFGLVAFFQILLPVRMIQKQEKILTTGNAFSFRVRPAYQDAGISGKYINLEYLDLAYLLPEDEVSNYKIYETVFLTLQNDSAGFAQIARIQKEVPKDTKDYIVATIRSIVDLPPKKLYFEVGFQQFFLEESRLSDQGMDKIRQQVDAANNAYARVRVLNGQALIQELIMDDVPLDQYRD